MSSSYSPSLRIELIQTGTQAGTWGTTTNTNLGTLIEDGICGYTSVSVTTADQALTAINGAEDQARNMTLAVTTTTTAPFNIYAPPSPKTYIIYNASAYAATIFNSSVIGNTTAAGSGVTIPAGRTVAVWSDGTNFDVQSDHFIGNVVGNVTGNVTGNLTGNVTGDVTGNLTGNVTGNVTGDVTGNADTATLATNATNATNAANLTGTSTSNIQSSALGSGTANDTTFLRGDRTFQPIPVSATTANVLSAIAGASFGAVGTYAFLSRIGATAGTFVQGSTYAGSTLAAAGFLRDNTGDAPTDGSSAANGTRGDTAVSGTWRCMGRVGSTNDRDLKMTLFLRIS